MLYFALVSPERQVRAGTVHMVVVPGSEGDFGVLEGHSPMLSTIRSGAIQVYETAGAAPERIFVDGGFAEVTASGLTILAEHAVPVAEIDAARLDADLAAARAAGPDAAFRLARLEAMRAVVTQ